MFLRDYCLNTCTDMDDTFYYASPGRDIDSLLLWCLGA
jgi:hypothetical protein